MKSLVPARELKTLRQQGESILQTANTLQVTGETHKQAIDLLALTGEAKKQLEAKRKVAVDPLNKKVKEINAFFRSLAEPFETADRVLRGKVLQFRSEEEKRRKEAEEKLRETSQFAVVPQLAKTQRAELGQAIAQKVWEFEVVDPKQVPRDYLRVDESAIRRAIMQGIRNIPGVKIYQTERLTVRRS